MFLQMAQLVFSPLNGLAIMTCFLHSSADEHVGCFHVLAVINSAAVNPEVHVSFGIHDILQV